MQGQIFRILLLLQVYLGICFAENNESLDAILDLQSDQSGFVHGVNVITGDYVDVSVDLVIPGPQPLVLKRSYHSRKGVNTKTEKRDRYILPTMLFDAWTIHHGGYAYRDQYSDDDIHAVESSGIALKYSTHLDPAFYLPYFEQFEKGFTNTSKEISGRTNLKNCRFKSSCVDPRTINYWEQQKGDGGVKRFRKSIKKNQLLELETFSNGFAYQYNYVDWLDEHENLLKSIHLLKNNVSLGHFQFDYNLENTDPCMHVYSDGNQNVEYRFEKKHRHLLLNEVIPSNGPIQRYTYGRANRIIRKQVGDHYFLELDYHPEKHHNSAAYKIGRVSTIKEPVENSQIATPVYTFQYDEEYKKVDINRKELLKGTTTVVDAYGHKTEYKYDAKSRLKNIVRYNGDAIHRQDNIFWGLGGDISNLITRTITDGKTKVHAGRHLIYDISGNIAIESIFGHLTGHPTLSPDVDINVVPPLEWYEQYIKGYAYSGDDLNLCVYEHDNRIHQFYEYYPKTNLLKWHYIKDGAGSIKQRQYYIYDKYSAVCLEVTDDGIIEGDITSTTGVTERYTKEITNTESFPFGLPKVIKEYCENPDVGSRKLVKMIENEYDLAGFLIKRHVYDENECLYSTHTWEYDACGNCIKEVNAEGHMIKRHFDSCGNKLWETGPCLAEGASQFTYYYTYDAMNRLIKEELRYHQNDHINTHSLFTHHTYDFYNRRTSTTDWCGHVTRYEYDAFGNMTRVIHPSISHEGGSIAPCTEARYNLLNQPVNKIDALGNITVYFYNLRGQPCVVEHPDGSSEYYRYSVDGCLEEKGERNGTRTLYKNDHLKRVVEKVTLDKDGNHLTATYATYSQFHLLTEADPAGNITFYDYENGRLSCKRKGAAKETYHYDALGRLVETRSYYGPGETDYVAERKKIDQLNRVVLDETIDGLGHISRKVEYTYDLQGNPTRIRTYTSPDEYAETSTNFDALGQPLESCDAEGNLTLYYYHYNPGEFTKEVCDANGKKTFFVYDALGRIHKELSYNAFSIPLQQKECFYSLNGNLELTRDHVFVAGQCEKTMRTYYEYDAMNQLIRMIEAINSPDEKTTRHRYNQYGQKTQTIKPDGIAILYEYDALGRVIQYYDNKTFSYAYTYDANSNVIAVCDNVNDTSTSKSYDANDRLIMENLANELSMQYAYDGMGRVLQVILPDQSKIDYRYEGERLKEIAKMQDGQIRYIHNYLEYNLAGKLLQSQLIGNAGKLDFDYDILHRPKNIKSAHWQENIPLGGFDKVSNLLLRSIKDSQGTIDCHYAYDELYQLTNETGVESHAYSNDSLYNRRQKDDVKHTLNFLNQLTNEGENTYLYDHNGNLRMLSSPDKMIIYEYDGLDRLVKVRNGSDEIVYEYDDLSRRLRKKIYQGGVLQSNVRYLYYGQNEIGSCDNQGHWIDLRILGVGLGAEIGAAVAIELPGKVYAPVHDSNGNVMTLLDAATGNVFEGYRYTAFGEENIPEETQNLWRYASKRKDDETGFIYFGRRYYSPEIGRFVTSDPLGYDAGPNLYAYVLNNPLTHFDAYGLLEEEIFEDNRANDNLSSDRDRGQNNIFDNVRDFFSGFFHDALDSFLSVWDELGIERPYPVDFSDPEDVKKFTTGLCQALGAPISDGETVIVGLPCPGAGATKLLKEKITSDKTIKKFWSTTKDKTSVENAYKHWQDHCPDFPEIKNAKAYVEKAISFIKSPPEGTLVKLRENGDKIYYHPDSNIFVVENKFGCPKTMYKPNTEIHGKTNNLEYFYDQ